MRYIMLFTLFLMSCSMQMKCDKKNLLTITQVGGCDEDGMCGVIFSNGEEDTMFFPVKGGKVVKCTSESGDYKNYKRVK